MAGLPLISSRLSAPFPRRWWTFITALMLIIVELCWVVPWFRTVLRISRVAPVFDTALALGLVMAAAYLLTQVMERTRLISPVQLVGFILALISAILAVQASLLKSTMLDLVDGLLNLDPGAILVMFFVIWMWWRGFSLARESIRPLVAWRRFELGLLLFMAHIFIVNRLGETGPGLGWFVFFFITGFTAVILARVSYIGLSKGVVKNPFDRRWLISTLSILGSAVVIAAVFSSLLTGQYRLILTWSAEAIKFLVAAFVFLVSLPGLALSFLAGPILERLRRLFHYQPAALEPIDLDTGAYPLIQAAPQARPIPENMQAFLFWGIVLLVILLLFFRVRRSLGGQTVDEKDGLESMLKQGEGRKLLWQSMQQAFEDFSNRFKPVRRRLAAARIRRIYAELMDLCADLGLPRPPSRTPFEFLPVMTEILSAVQVDLGLLTDAYVGVRYGVHPETKDEIDRVEAAWERIKAEGQRMKKAGLQKLTTAEVTEVLKPGM